MNTSYWLRGSIVHTPLFGIMECIPDSYIVVINGRTAGLFSSLPLEYTDLPLYDYTGKIITPAFCDMHLHAPQYPMLGLGMDLQLLEWLNTYTFVTEQKFKDSEFARKVYSALAKKLVECGTTRVCMFSSIHYDATMILMEELENAGISGYVGKVNMDRNSPDYLSETTQESIEQTRRWIEESKKRFTHISPIITPRFTPSCTDELMEALGKFSQEYDLPIQSHLSENTDECAWVRELCPDCPQYWESYEKRGLFNSRTIMAHCVYSNFAEREAMRKHGVWVAHCPDSNSNLSSGIAPVRKMLREGLSVALGSDIAGGAEISMLKVVGQAIRVSKLRYLKSDKAEDFLTVAEALYLATSAGQEFFGEKAGFAVGNEFHALVFDDSALPPTDIINLQERMERLIYLADSSAIVDRFACKKL